MSACCKRVDQLGAVASLAVLSSPLEYPEAATGLRGMRQPDEPISRARLAARGAGARSKDMASRSRGDPTASRAHGSTGPTVIDSSAEGGNEAPGPAGDMQP